MEYEIAGLKAKTNSVEDKPLNIFLWGLSGAGKTTLASTLPGKVLFIQFDPNGTSSLGERDDIVTLDLATEGDGFLIKMRTTDPMDLGKFLEKFPEFSSIVLDSFTTLNEKALPRAVAESKNSTLDLPGQHGYAKRNMIMSEIVTKLLSVCLKYKKNLCVIAHEGPSEKDEMTGRLFKTFIAGGAIPNVIPLRFDEVWYLEDAGKEKRIHIRSNLNRHPMKSRIFDTTNTDSFAWKYNPSTNTGHLIKDWIKLWKERKSKITAPV